MEASTDELEQLCVSDDGWEHPKEKKGVKIHMRSVEGTAIVMYVAFLALLRGRLYRRWAVAGPPLGRRWAAADGAAGCVE